MCRWAGMCSQKLLSKKDLLCHLSSLGTAGDCEIPQHGGAATDLGLLASTPEHTVLRPLVLPCHGDPGLCDSPQLLPGPSLPGWHGKLGGDPNSSPDTVTPQLEPRDTASPTHTPTGTPLSPASLCALIYMWRSQPLVLSSIQ